MATWTVQQAGDWSRTSNNADSPWYDAGTQTGWAGVPADGDTVNGKATTNVNFDVDQSGFAAGLAALDLKGGYITFKEGMTTYLKVVGALTLGSGGELRAGTSEAVPFTVASDATIMLAGSGALIGTNGIYKVYCSEPTVKSVPLSNTEAIGQTRFEIGTDLTGYSSHWKAASLIRIDDYAGGSEQREISAVAAGYIDVTAGLTKAKIAGSYVHLVTRNFRILCGATTISTAMIQYGSGTLNAEVRSGNTLTAGFTGRLMTLGGTISNVSYGINLGRALAINSVISGIVTGGLSECMGCRLNGQVSGVVGQGIRSGINNFVSTTGKVTGCGAGMKNEVGAVVMGELSGNYYAVDTCSGYLIGATLKDNIAADLWNRCNFVGYASSLQSGVQSGNFVNNSAGASESGYGQVKIDNYAGAGTTYAWMYAGTVIPRSGGDPTLSAGTTLKYVPLVATHQTYIDYSLGNLSIGQKVKISVYMKHSATGFTQRGKFEVFHWSDDPFFGGTALYSWTALDNTDEQFSGYEFEALEAGEHILRISCKNASGNLFASAITSVISEELTTLDRIEAYVDTLETLIGTPVALDGGTATIAGMLTKMADDNGGADFNAEIDSLHEKQGTSAEDVADAVWDEAIADHTTGTTFGGKNQKVVPSESVNDYKATGFAVAGDQMDLVNAPNSTAITAIKTGLGTVPASGNWSIAGDKMDLVDAPNATAISAIKTGLGTVPASGNWAIAGDEMNLANDAIKAAKFDESTAFPVKSADTGSTALARTGADADTLETLSDQIDTAQTSLDELLDEYDLWWDTANNKFYIYEKGTSTVYEEYDTTVDSYGKLTRLDKV